MNINAIILILSKMLSLGELRATSIDGWCDIEVDKIAYGPTPVASIMLSEGYHQVRCTTLNKKDSEVFPVYISAGKVQRFRFVILTRTWQDMTVPYGYFEE